MKISESFGSMRFDFFYVGRFQIAVGIERLTMCVDSPLENGGNVLLLTGDASQRSDVA